MNSNPEISVDDAIADVDVYSDPERYHTLFARLRKEQPVRWTQPGKYRPFWAVTRHADIAEVQRKPAIFLSAPRTQLNTIEAEDKIRAATGRHQVQRTVISTDGEEHALLRGIAQSWFLPQSVRKLEDDITQIARHFIDRMVELGGRCDFSQDIAVWYPLRVILRIFGLSDAPEAEQILLRMSKQINGAFDPDVQRSSSPGEHMLTVVNELFDYFRPIVDERRRNPKNDLASVIANATMNGAPLSNLDVFSWYLSIAVAGHDTTSAATAGGLLALLQNPDEMAKLRARPELVRTAMDEMVRWTHPVKHFFRTAAQDYVLRGQQVREGDSLLMCYPSACRDEDVFVDPFAFRVDRSPNQHLGFGIGPHVCLGQYLAKLEMSIFYRELLARIDDIQLEGDAVQSRTLFMGGLKRLPIRYNPRRELANAS
ncbi:MAG TPA: cytochrome P450 [Steroidobacter sp.]|nr:cytochrome P450 [Steroidobacter sp.]